MAVKKKTRRLAKLNPKKKKSSSAKAGAGLTTRIQKTSKKVIDNVLVKIQPPLQDKIDQLIVTLEKGRDGTMSDLSVLAGKILLRAQEISKSLRTVKKKK